MSRRSVALVLTCTRCGKQYDFWGGAPARAKYCPDCRAEVMREHARTQYAEMTQEQRKDRCRRIREKYHGDPNVRERKIANAARYSEEHREERRAYDKAFYAANRDRVILRVAAWKDENRDRYLKLRRLHYAIGRGDVSAKVKLAEAKGNKVYCERLHLKAYPLPCGNYPSCNHCPSCPKEGVKTLAWKEAWE